MKSSEILAQLRTVDGKTFESESERRLAVAEAHSLISRLETPWESVFRYVWTYPTLMATIEIAQNLDLFRKWKAAGGGPRTETELHQMVSCDSDLFGRIIRHLAAGRVIGIDKSGSFISTEFGTALADDKTSAAAHFFYKINMPAFMSLPGYLKSLNHQDPSTGQGNWKFGHGEDIWPWLKANPEADKTLGMVMAAHATHRTPLLEIYPTDELVARNSDAQILIVDVGGGIGHDLEAFNNAHPQPPGRLVLQDRPEVIETVKVSPAIKPIPHDFMTPNPVQGAAVYFLHNVLHDWSNKDASRILEVLKPALTRGIGKVLVQEIVVSNGTPNLQATTQDITMMGMASARERTEYDWRQVFDAAGYKINKIWSAPLNYESVIEAEPA